MKKKRIVTSILIALLAGLVLINVAQAQTEPGYQRGGQRRIGQVSEVGDDWFAIGTRAANETRLKVTEETHFRTQDWQMSTLADLEAGQWVAVVASSNSANEEVQLTAGTLTMQTRQGDHIVITIGEGTRFRSPGGEIEDISDLEPEMLVLVVAKDLGEGELLADIVAAAKRGQLPKFDLRVTGEVIAIEADSFTVQMRDGVTYAFEVNETTRFISRRNQTPSLSDMTLGMRVGVGAKAREEGHYQALVVFVGQTQP